MDRTGQRIIFHWVTVTASISVGLVQTGIVVASRVACASQRAERVRSIPPGCVVSRGRPPELDRADAPGVRPWTRRAEEETGADRRDDGEAPTHTEPGCARRCGQLVALR